VFGTFLELGLPAPAILESLAFYRELGFTELVTADIRRHHYAVVTDGALTIGLHGGGLEEPTLAFVMPGLERHARSLAGAGRAFAFLRLGPEEFHEAGLRTPDGLLVTLMEARTFPPGDEDDVPPSLLGRCNAIALGCASLAETVAFFEDAGFLATQDEQDPAEALLTTPGLTLAVRESRRPTPPQVTFAATHPGAVVAALQARDFPVARAPGGWRLTAPEGTVLVLEDR
jgi:hypothetical protein